MAWRRDMEPNGFHKSASKVSIETKKQNQDKVGPNGMKPSLTSMKSWCQSSSISGNGIPQLESHHKRCVHMKSWTHMYCVGLQTVQMCAEVSHTTQSGLNKQNDNICMWPGHDPSYPSSWPRTCHCPSLDQTSACPMGGFACLTIMWIGLDWESSGTTSSHPTNCWRRLQTGTPHRIDR